MAYEAYRVRTPFRWNGWHYGPQHLSLSIDEDTGTYKPCDCPYYAGNIWIVEENHPRKAPMLNWRKAVYDASFPSAEELMKDPAYARLLNTPDELRPKEIVKPTSSLLTGESSEKPVTVNIS